MSEKPSSETSQQETPKEEYNRVEEEIKRMKQVKQERERPLRGHGLNYYGRRISTRRSRLAELKGEAKVEGDELNEEYDQLIEKAMKSLHDLRQFEINKLGMKPENAIAGDLDDHREAE